MSMKKLLKEAHIEINRAKRNIGRAGVAIARAKLELSYQRLREKPK